MTLGQLIRLRTGDRVLYHRNPIDIYEVSGIDVRRERLRLMNPTGEAFWTVAKDVHPYPPRRGKR